MKKRILPLALSLCLCLALMPAASATESLGFPDAFQGDGYYITATPYEIQDDDWYIDSNRGISNFDFHEGLIIVYRNAQGVDDQGYYTGAYQRVGYADKTGKVVLTFDDWENPPASAGLTGDGSSYFSEGLCVYLDRKTSRYGYLNVQGEPVIPAQYKYAQPFQDGLARVTTYDDDILFIDKTGQVAWTVGDDLYVDWEYSDGLLGAQGYLDNGDYFVGFLDKQGQPAITIYQSKWNDYSEDEYLSVRETGNFSRFSGGYAILHDYRGGRRYPAYVVIDTQGNQVSVIDAQAPSRAYIYPRNAIFSEGFVQVDFVDTDGPGTGFDCYVDVHGNVAFELPGPTSLAGPILSGLAVINGTQMYDQTGTLIIPHEDVLEELLPALENNTLAYGVGLSDMYDNVGLARVHYGLNTYYYLLEKHDGTYTGPGVVYDAATGAIRQGGGTTDPEPTPDPEPSADQPSSWAAEQVNAAIAAGLVPEALQAGYTGTATRAQFCALAVELYETVTGSEIAERATFSDTSDVNVQKMAGIGVINGVGNGQFNPSGQLTREQAATILVRLADAMGQPLPEGTASFADNASIASWAIEAVGRAQAGGLMGGIGNNQFSPQGPYTVEQSIMTAFRLYETVQ